MVDSRDRVRAEVEIAAPIEQVWAILVDFERYGEWNSFTPRARTSLRIGDPIDMHVRLGGPLPLPWRERVTRNEPYTLGWQLVLVLRRLLVAERLQTLTPIDEERTHYCSEDRFDGLLRRPVLALFGGAMTRGFEACARDLRRVAERHAPKPLPRARDARRPRPAGAEEERSSE